jgi:hypothetical protein
MNTRILDTPCRYIFFFGKKLYKIFLYLGQTVDKEKLLNFFWDARNFFFKFCKSFQC